MNEVLSTRTKDRTLYYCKKHRNTPIKFVEINKEGQLPHYHYYCEECAKEKKK